MRFDINVYLTTSKFAAYVILAIGTTYSFVFHDSAVLLATFSAVSAILMMKTYTTMRTDMKRVETLPTGNPVIPPVENPTPDPIPEPDEPTDDSLYQNRG